jgi:hypothetical protein
MGSPMISQYGKVKLESWQGSGCHRNFTVTHHCQKRDGVHERRLVPLGSWSVYRVGWKEELSSGHRKVKVVITSVFNGIRRTTDMFLDRSHMIHQKYRTCTRIYFEGQVPEWPRVWFHVGDVGEGKLGWCLRLLSRNTTWKKKKIEKKERKQQPSKYKMYSLWNGFHIISSRVWVRIKRKSTRVCYHVVRRTTWFFFLLSLHFSTEPLKLFNFFKMWSLCRPWVVRSTVIGWVSRFTPTWSWPHPPCPYLSFPSF